MIGPAPRAFARVWQQYREEGRDYAAFANCGRRPTLDEAGQQQLLTLAGARPDAFCCELADELHATLGVRLSRQTIGRWLTTLGLTQKKSLHASEQTRKDVKQQRSEWMVRLVEACAGDFTWVLFLKETGALTNLTRTHGRCVQGERCIAQAPAGHWQTMTAVAASRLSGLTAAATTPYAMDDEPSDPDAELIAAVE